MKNFIKFVIALAFTTFIHQAKAQTYTMNWASAFSPAWATGTTTRNANNIAGSGVNCNVQLLRSGGIFTTTLGSYGGPMTPTVSASTFIVGGSSSNIQVSLEFDNNTQYMDAVFTFNRPVFNVSFNVADIDRLTNTTYNYLDQITVTGYNGALSGSPTITKFDAVTDPNFLIVSGNTAYVNPVDGMSGNTASDATDQKGTIRVRFGGVYITSFRVRYSNFAGTQADPTVQNISIGNIRFQTSIPLPVTISSFDGKANDDGTIGLNWTTKDEYNFDYFSIERSENGVSFNEIGRINSNGVEVASQYIFNDIRISAAKYYYRLRMVDLDGTFNYTKVITISPKKFTGLKAYPTVFQNNVNVSVFASKQDQLKFIVFNMSGERVFEVSYPASPGNNEFNIIFPETSPKGQYLVRLEYSQNRDGH